MPVVFSCGCGQTLRVADALAGQKARCPKCQAVVTAPAASPAPPPKPAPAAPKPARPAVARAAPPPVSRPAAIPVQFIDDDEDDPRPVRPRRPAHDDEDDDDPAPPKRGKKPAPAGPKKKLILLIAAAAVALLGGVAAVGIAVYYFASGPSADERLYGDWELDPEANAQGVGVGAPGGAAREVRIGFHKDHTYDLTAGKPWYGKWSVVSWDGKTAKLKLTADVYGKTADNPVRATATFIDADHLEYDDGGSQGARGVFRRVGAVPTGGGPPGSGQAGGDWGRYTLGTTGASLTLPASPQPGDNNRVTLERTNGRMAYAEYWVTPPAGGPMTSILVRTYADPTAPDPADQAGRAIEEYVGVSFLRTYSPLQDATPTLRTDGPGGRGVAVFVRPADPGAGVYLAVGNEKLVVVVAFFGPNLAQNDPTVLKVFRSMAFP